MSKRVMAWGTARWAAVAAVALGLSGSVFAQARDPAPPANVPVVKAEAGPIKIKPSDPGGLRVPHGDKSIYDRIATPRQVVPAGDPKRPRQVAAVPGAKPDPKKPAQAIGPYRIQVGSFKDSQAANKRWAELNSKHGDLVGKLQMVLERVELGGKGTMYRLQAGPLKSADDVQRLCTALRGRKVGCLLVKS